MTGLESRTYGLGSHPRYIKEGIPLKRGIVMNDATNYPGLTVL